MQRHWPDSAIVELVDMIERLTAYCRVGGVDELDGEYDDLQAAEAILRQYKPVLSLGHSAFREERKGR